MKKAFHIARTGRPGPVVVDIPKDVSFKKAAFTATPKSVEMRSYNPVRKGHGGQIRKALQLLLDAKRPYIYTGGGVLLGNAVHELRTLVDMLGYPVHPHPDGPGRLSRYRSKNSLGMLGMHGTVEANNAMQNCDVLLAVGARFDDRVIGNPKHFAAVERKIIHIDIDPSSHLQARQGGRAHRGRCQGRADRADRHDQGGRRRKPDAGALASLVGRRSKAGAAAIACSYDRGSTEVIKPQVRGRNAVEPDQGRRLLHHLRRRPAPDVGGPVSTSSTSRAAGSTPAAWAPWAWACPTPWASSWPSPEAEVFCVTGEGSIQMNIQELSTCKQYDTPVKIVRAEQPLPGHGAPVAGD